jgi:NADP-dependent 3-hydroxy acid dehydrogenase YdfG
MDLKLDFDMSEEDGRLRPTVHDCTDRDDEVTQMKLPMLYDTAMTMIDGATPEVKLVIWRLVVDKLIDRVGMENKEFTTWASRILAGASGESLSQSRVVAHPRGHKCVTVLVVGGGNLGSALKIHLESLKGVSVRVASRSSNDVKLNIMDPESVRSLDAQLQAASVDHVVVCCGTSTFGPLTGFDAAKWKENIDGKLLSVTSLVLALVQDLKILKDGGSIAVTTGGAATVVNKMWPGLAVNNAGLNAFVRNAGIDLPRGIRLNACSPCLVYETAVKAGLPTANTVKSADAALVYERLIFGSETGIVEDAGEQTAFKRKEEGLAKTSDL